MSAAKWGSVGFRSTFDDDTLRGSSAGSGRLTILTHPLADIDSSSIQYSSENSF